MSYMHRREVRQYDQTDSWMMDLDEVSVASGAPSFDPAEAASGLHYLPGPLRNGPGPPLTRSVVALLLSFHCVYCACLDWLTDCCAC